MKKEPVEEIIVPSEEREKILNDSTVSKFVTKKWIEINSYQAVNILPTKI